MRDQWFDTDKTALLSHQSLIHRGKIENIAQKKQKFLK